MISFPCALGTFKLHFIHDLRPDFGIDFLDVFKCLKVSAAFFASSQLTSSGQFPLGAAVFPRENHTNLLMAYRFPHRFRDRYRTTGAIINFGFQVRKTFENIRVIPKHIPSDPAQKWEGLGVHDFARTKRVRSARWIPVYLATRIKRYNKYTKYIIYMTV